MGDFFSRLSERALGNTAGVRPNLMPLMAWTEERSPSFENFEDGVLPKYSPESRQSTLQTEDHETLKSLTQVRIITNDDGGHQTREANRHTNHEHSDRLITKVTKELPALSRVPIADEGERVLAPQSKVAKLPIAPNEIVQPNAARPRQEILPASSVSFGKPAQTTRSQSDPRPTVRVTIGRLEVRAVSAHANVPEKNTEARRNPHLSLAEYLRQRNEGGR